MLLVILFIFLLTEIPNGAVVLLYTLCTFRIISVPSSESFNDTLKKLTSLCNLMLLISYGVNFIVYCGMSRHFREALLTALTHKINFIQSFCCKPLSIHPKHRQRNSYEMPAVIIRVLEPSN